MRPTLRLALVLGPVLPLLLAAEPPPLVAALPADNLTGEALDPGPIESALREELALRTAVNLVEAG